MQKENSKVSAGLPYIISMALERISRLCDYSPLVHAGDRVRSMRCERKEAVLAVVQALLRCACIQRGGIAIRMTKRREGVLATVRELAQLAGLTVDRTIRALTDLKSAGLVDVAPQQKVCKNRKLIAAPCIRRLSDTFWRILGLWEAFQAAIKYYRKKPPVVIRLALFLITAYGVQPLNRTESKCDPEERQRQINNRAFICLFREHGGKRCINPQCGNAQNKACQRIDQLKLQ